MIDHAEKGESDVHEILFLDFTPSAIYAHTDDANKILLGGSSDEGKVILVEFEFQFQGGFKVVKNAEPFADVSLLGSICDMSFVEVGGEEVLFLLDGQYGLVGTVARGGAFQEVSSPEQRMELIGKRTLLSHTLDRKELRLSFSPQMPGACVDAEDQDWFRMQSLDDGHSFQEWVYDEKR